METNSHPWTTLRWMNEQKYVLILCSFDVWNIYLHFRQLGTLVHFNQVPEVLLGVIAQEEFDAQRAQASFFIIVSMLSVATRMYNNLRSYHRKYPSVLWKITGAYSDNSSIRAILFSFFDEVVSKIVVVPIIVILATLQKGNPFSVLMTGFFWILSSSMITAIQTAVMIKLTDHSGADAFLQIAILFDSLVLIANYFFIELFAPVWLPKLPEGATKANIDAVAIKSGYYPRHGIFMEPNVKGKVNDPNAYHIGLLGASMIVVSESLLKIVGPNDIVAVVAHELGHWHHQHSLYGLIGGFVHSACFTLSEMFCYGNSGVNEYFSMDQSDPPHPIIAVMLFSKYIYPLIGSFLMGLHGIVSYFCEFTADNYAVTMGFGAELRRSLLTILKEVRTFPVVDSWYAAWFRGHPSMVKRIERLKE